MLWTITPVTASRDLKTGVEQGLLVRAGDKRTAVYRFSVKVPR
jgi:Fic family protein